MPFLFPDNPAIPENKSAARPVVVRGAPRLRPIERSQAEMRCVSLDQLLLHEELIDLQRVAQDGMKVRASAGASSFCRESTLQKSLAEAQQQVAALRSHVDEDAGAASQRQQAARRRAAAERCQRVQQALAERQKLLDVREQQQKDKNIMFDPAELRTSTTDPEARSPPTTGTLPLVQQPSRTWYFRRPLNYNHSYCLDPTESQKNSKT